MSSEHPTDPSPAPELHGIDVSHHNRPDWPLVSQSSNFVYCRATYGTMRDRLVSSHVAAARQAGLHVGLYHFHRPSQDAGDQADAFLAVADSLGIGDGDLVHALDIEADVSVQVHPSWEPGVRALADRLSRDAGTPCVVYTTAREWRMLGNPEWLRDHPLWVAHWIGPREPATPLGMQWEIQQYRVAQYDPWASQPKDGPSQPGALDHNRARQPMPTIQTTKVAPVRPRRQVQLIQLASDYDSRSRARDQFIQQQDSDDE